MIQYLLDTNIVILHLNKIEQIPEQYAPYGISAITLTELLQFSGLSSKDLAIIRDLIEQYFFVFPVTDTIATLAGELGRTQKTEIIDRIIAATALEHNIALVTKNTKDFKGIKGLKLKTLV